MSEFTREQLREFNKKHYGSVAARFAQSAEEMLIELERGGSSPVHNQVSQSGEAGSKGGPQNAGDDIRVLQLKLRDADIVMKVIDDLIKGGALDARSIIGDARLNYGDPYDYKYLQG